MKSIIYSVAAMFMVVCFALAQQAPDSVANDSNPSSFQLRAQTGTNNTVTLTWRGDPTSPGFIVYESIPARTIHCGCDCRPECSKLY